MAASNIITLAQICKQKKIKPKIARSRLRRALAMNRPVPPVLEGHRWSWPKSQMKDVVPYISD